MSEDPELRRDVPESQRPKEATMEAHDGMRENSASEPRVIGHVEKSPCRTAETELWQGVWECSQFMTPGQIVAYVGGVLREIETDHA